ncbi:MAG: hypothetical protein R6V85_01015 [Polyangia bacterium]
MCLSTDFSTGAKLAAFAAVALLAAACNRGDGGSPEVCNHFDDDMDGVTDDPFIDADGIYDTVEHCGDCGIDCAAVFPSAESVTCVVEGGSARCAITACPEGHHLIGDSYCAADQSVLCLPCENDADCAQIDPSALCLTLPGGDTRCGAACDPEAETSGCPQGFWCGSQGVGGQCTPLSGSCACIPENAGQQLGCWVESPNGESLCPGLQLCDGEQLTECEPILEEICDLEDNDCDGQTDEGFVQDGYYVSDDHCGACNHPCFSPAENTQAHCELSADGPICEYECMPGFADIDGLALNGCECEMFAAQWPPGALGVDGNCDGEIDDTSEFVFVSKDGDDADPGTLEAPLLTIARGVEIAEPWGKTVLVSQGTYDEQVAIASGVSIFGGYRSDFLERDAVLFEVRIEHGDAPGMPVLIAEDVHQDTKLGGLTIAGGDGVSPGDGTTAVRLVDCGPELELSEMIVEAGAGADGTAGACSSEILAALGAPSPSLLDGAAGGSGQAGQSAWNIWCSGLLGDGGSGGDKLCPVDQVDVGGGDGGDASCPATGCTIGEPCGNAGCTDFTVGDECDFEAVYEAAVPNPPAEDGHGPGGGEAGELTYDAPTTMAGLSFCDDNPTLRREGDDGHDGQPGSSGLGGEGAAAPEAQIDVITGLWSAGDGGDGGNGSHGGGGGGGTQGNGYDALPGGGGSADHLGGAGGGGGSGGCGAPGAAGGGGGGGSIGVLIELESASSGPTLYDVRVVPGPAGDGGDGGVGLAGGDPGPGGLGGEGNFWCARRGGRGGDGGHGGSGGGGGGGGGGSISGFHVLAPFLSGDYLEALEESNSVDALPAPGDGGDGGFSPGDSGGNGADGTTQAFRVQLVQ